MPAKSKNPQVKTPKIFCLVFYFTIFLISGCSGRNELTEEMVLMGTTARITIVSKSPLAEQAMREAFSIMQKFDRNMNFFSPDSELTKINNLAVSRPVLLTDTMLDVIDKAVNYSKITDGAFDVTATSLQRKGGYDTIVIDKLSKTVYFKDKRTKIDLGGIVDGYCIDKAAECFKQLGIEDYLIDIGGDIYAHGKNKKGRFWQIGIRDPLKEEELVGQVEVRNGAIATSGNYEREHIKDPSGGKLPRNNILSVTVIAEKCIDADALATAFFVMGLEETKEFLRQHQNIKAKFIVNNSGRSGFIDIN